MNKSLKLPLKVLFTSTAVFLLLRLCLEADSTRHLFLRFFRKQAGLATDPSSSVRLGSDLNFDVSQCPSGSYMLNRRLEFAPKHLNCPTLFIVGARKGGTTSLIQYISKHPDFEGIKLDVRPGQGIGESFYFADEYKKTWEQYMSLFPQGGVMTGDSSVANLVHSLVPKRIYHSCGKQAKVVMLLRDPVERLVSAFLMRVRLGTNKMGSMSSLPHTVEQHLDNFLKAVSGRDLSLVDLPRRWSEFVGLFHPASNMIYEGLYYVHLLNWLCNFPAENILIVNSEEFFRDPGKILDMVVQFLGLKRLAVETYAEITSTSYNRGDYGDVPDHQKLTASHKRALLAVFRPFNQVLFELLHWNSSLWST